MRGPSARDFQGISPVSNGTCLWFVNADILGPPGETESGSAHDASETRDIQVPVRQWRVRPLMAYVTRGRSLESHWTPDPCLRKSCGAAAIRVTTCVCAPFSRMNLLFLVLANRVGCGAVHEPSGARAQPSIRDRRRGDVAMIRKFKAAPPFTQTWVGRMSPPTGHVVGVAAKIRTRRCAL